jgi:DNA-binding LacI/PurR family transcriptional regulator
MSDPLAIGAMWAARELGLHVPEDLSVVGFDDLEMAPHSNPPLTTVHQPIRGKGEEAARLLLRMIASPDLERPEHKILETRLIIRASTAVPRPGKRVVPRLSRTGLERGALGR